MKPTILFVLLFSFGVTVSAQEQSFDEWLEQLRVEARSLGISDTTLTALDSLEAPLERVLELDGSQPEFVQTFSRYMGLRVTDRQVARGQALLQQHATLLEEVRQKYSMQPQYLIAFWAIESNFGSNTGGFSVLQALATLAFDPRRAEMFRREILTALKIIDEGHITAANMSGSWAGAMGQLQFMPSIFERYGVDGDGDGQIDIWNSLPDIFHSAANFMSSAGWKGDERWGREVLLPSDFDFALAGTNTRKPLQQWRDIGILRVSGGPIPVAEMQASIVIPSGANGPAFLVYDNFRVTRTYNSPIFYALTVGHLADRFSGGAAIQHMPESEQAMSIADVTEMQEYLNSLGFDSGAPDGRVGSRTRSAIRSFQEQQQLPMDSYPSHSLLEKLRNLF
ncbi:MAG: lytic murein transglycosylase [SAR86 cluster bacterium]|uniref:Lytic murein transglycosylase n=1 Tax=SAR86 cluster bacterium TaxID=2030880 RepID=A0A2A5B504_9GAMM|nr:MAG: lytic murein transglycosylase [SAR86 cluster bacterium]